MTQEPKHSPGPWEAVHVEEYSSINAHDEREVCAIDYPDEAERANLELMAAAPDLLVAAQHFVKWCDKFPQPPQPKSANGELYARFKAAIAKATQEPVK